MRKRMTRALIKDKSWDTACMVNSIADRLLSPMVTKARLNLGLEAESTHKMIQDYHLITDQKVER